MAIAGCWAYVVDAFGQYQWLEDLEKDLVGEGF